jgi:drug/metabolite transporter (DMT)-like permease
MGVFIQEYFSPQLVFYVFSYTLAACGEVWLIKAVNYNWDANVPTLCAMLVNAYWPIQMVIYYFVRKTQPAPDRENFPWGVYTFMGFSGGAVSLMRAIGISNLSGVFYVICSNTEVVFSAVLSVIVLEKKLNMYQILGVLLVVGAVIFAVWDPNTGGFSTGSDEEGASQQAFIIGVSVTIGSRFLSSLQSVIAEKTLGKSRKSPWGVNEITIAQAIIPSFLLPLTLLVSKEEKKEWPALVEDGVPPEWLLVLIFVALSMVKLVDRLCKMSIIGEKSTLFFGGVDACMKSVAGIGAFLMFKKESGATWNEFVALVIIMIALGFTVYGETIADAVANCSGSATGWHALSMANRNDSSGGHVSYCFLLTSSRVVTQLLMS